MHAKQEVAAMSAVRAGAVAVWVAVAVALASPGAAAQTATSGSIVGTVKDQSGAVVPGASVELKDAATGAVRKAETNQAGQYAFTPVAPGLYTVTVTAKGFRQAVVTEIKVEVVKSSLVDVVLQLGEVAETVQVEAGARVELQTVNAAVGEVVDSRALVNLPTMTRRAVELLYLQVGAQPWTGWAGNGSSGTVAGGKGDQNNFTLNGMDISDNHVGGTCCGNFGPGIPIPVEAVEEFRATVSNQNATTGRSTGGEFAFVTRRGSPDYHGAVYWYFQNDDFLQANTWTRNRLGQPKPELKDNRYGFRIGGPLLGPVERQNLFFFLNMEGRRFPQRTDVSGIMPSASLRQGILRFRDGTGSVVSYDLATSSLCGPSNSSACDPRGIGLSPVIADQFAILPDGNDPSTGDGLNTIGLRGATDSSQKDDNIVARVDYNVTAKWSMNATWLWAEHRVASPNMHPGIDFRGGADNIVTDAFITNYPRMYTFALNGTITPNLTNEFRVGYNRSTIGFSMPQPEELVSGAGMALHLAFLDDPIQDIGSARSQIGLARTWQFTDNLNWIKGKHVLQGGTNIQLLRFFHSRVQRSGANIAPVANIGSFGNLTIPSNQRPPTCASPGQANCLLPSDVGRWDGLYAAVTGIIDNVVLATSRDAHGNAIPGPFENEGPWYHFEIYAADTWRIRPSLTLSLGVNGLIEIPYHDIKGRLAFLIDQQTGQPISVLNYLKTRADAARQGHIYNPGLAFAPMDMFPGRREFPLHKSLGPRLAAAWNPSFSDGFLGHMLGQGKTVIRGGYALGYHRPMAVGFVQFNMQGNSITATPAILNGPTNSAGQPFRVGVDGPAPLPSVPATIPIPYAPPVPYGDSFDLQWDPSYKFGYMHAGDLTIQRELRNNFLIEVGWIGRFGRRLEVDANINAVPFFIKDLSGLSNQTFAQAFDLVAAQLRAGALPATVTPQPWFENSIGAGATVTLATTHTSDFINGFVNDLWMNPGGIDSLLPTPVNNRQIRQTLSHVADGRSNYNALFVSLAKRPTHGLSFKLNYTLSKNLAPPIGISDSGTGSCMNPFDRNYCYGPALSDRRHGLNFYGTYDLPFGKGQRFGGGVSPRLNKLIGGWSTSTILTYFSGLPLSVYAGGQPFGNACCGDESAPLSRDPRADEGRHGGVSGSNGVGVAGDPAAGGSGLNLFSNPEAVFNSFRYFKISEDGRGSRGVIRGLPRFTWDLSVAKYTAVTERIGVRFSFDFFNVANHPLFNDPFLNLLDPASFGVINSQPGDPGNGDYWTPRRCQFGLRIEF
jgi:hypothetical protein